MKHISVVGAVIVQEGRVLCAQRGPQGTLAGLWEFPGGKIEAGETPEAALAREIREELDCEVEVGDLVTSTTHEYEFAVVTLATYWCTPSSGEPRASEHSTLQWVEPAKLSHLDWAPADVPAVELVTQRLAASGA